MRSVSLASTFRPFFPDSKCNIRHSYIFYFSTDYNWFIQVFIFCPVVLPEINSIPFPKQEALLQVLMLTLSVFIIEYLFGFDVMEVAYRDPIRNPTDVI